MVVNYLNEFKSTIKQHEPNQLQYHSDPILSFNLAVNKATILLIGTILKNIVMEYEVIKS